MPKVGKRTFAYDKKGKAQAKAEAKKMGMPVKHDETKPHVDKPGMKKHVVKKKGY